MLDFNRENRVKNAFTLTEIMITLLIIGVVAVMTLPTLTKKIQQYQTITKLKETVSMLNQAVKMSEADNGDMGGWVSTGHYFFDNYLKNYLKVTSVERFYSNGLNNHVTYKGIDGIRCKDRRWRVFNEASYVYHLNNGAAIFIAIGSATGNPNCEMHIDINGWKGPNVMGKDLFIFDIKPQYGVYPSGWYNSGECTFAKVPNKDVRVLTGQAVPPIATNGCKVQPCKKNLSGGWCAALIMTQDWKITKDYPW